MKLRSIAKLACAAAVLLALQPAPAAPPAVLASMPAVTPTDQVAFDVFLPLQHTDEVEALVARLHDPKSPQYRQWLTPSEFLARFGPSPVALAQLEASLRAHGLSVIERHAHGLRVHGPAAAVAATFSVELRRQLQQGRTRAVAAQALQQPADWQGLNARVIGLEALPMMQPLARVSGTLSQYAVLNRYGAAGPYWFDDLKQAYDYPAFGKSTDGSGVKVAVLISDLPFPDDLAVLFNAEQYSAITGRPVPTITTQLVDGGGVVGGYGSFEASIDVQQVLGGAPGSDVTVVSLPDQSDAHITEGYRVIVDGNRYDIVNSSFGACELFYTPAYNGGTDYTYLLQIRHELFLQGNAQGITFVAGSGDRGALECPSPDYGTPGASPVFGQGVINPASDPAVTAVGGGNLVTTVSTSTPDSMYVRESAFADLEAPYDPYGVGQNVSGGYWGAGGGPSAVFAKPAYQRLANTGATTQRTLPDVGMQVGGLGISGLDCHGLSCSPDDSSVVVAYGFGTPTASFYVAIGTSVASPEFVGALALYEQSLGKKHRVGNINYFLYAKGALQTAAGGANAPAAFQFFHRNIPGNDGLWPGGYPSANYDYLYGNGSPDVRKLFGLTAYPAAGTPQTPSNP